MDGLDRSPAGGCVTSAPRKMTGSLNTCGLLGANRQHLSYNVATLFSDTQYRLILHPPIIFFFLNKDKFIQLTSVTYYSRVLTNLSEKWVIMEQVELKECQDKFSLLIKTLVAITQIARLAMVTWCGLTKLHMAPGMRTRLVRSRDWPNWLIVYMFNGCLNGSIQRDGCNKFTNYSAYTVRNH